MGFKLLGVKNIPIIWLSVIARTVLPEWPFDNCTHRFGLFNPTQQSMQYNSFVLEQRDYLIFPRVVVFALRIQTRDMTALSADFQGGSSVVLSALTVIISTEAELKTVDNPCDPRYCFQRQNKPDSMCSVKCAIFRLPRM